MTLEAFIILAFMALAVFALVSAFWGLVKWSDNDVLYSDFRIQEEEMDHLGQRFVLYLRDKRGEWYKVGRYGSLPQARAGLRLVQ